MESTNKLFEQAIKTRSSVRTYNGVKLNNEIINKLKNFIKEIDGPFNEKVKFIILDSKDESHKGRLGTYGVIRGTSLFIAAAVKKGDMDLEELGYEMEKLVLYLTSLGVGTCWLGGMFKKNEFAKNIELDDDEIFPVISPIGYSSEKNSFVDSIIRLVAKSSKRKEWSEIFFLRDFTIPLTEHSTLGKFKEVLGNVRLAPSASNKQPWRIVKKGNEYHFFIERIKGYSEKVEFDIQRIDMGIAMCHFELTCKEHNIKGCFQKMEHNIKNIPNNTEYIISWIGE